MNRLSAALAALAVLAATPAAARDLAFTAKLSGTKAPTLTGSKATGAAHIVAHEESQTVDIAMDVDGLTVDDLWANLRPRPMGPIHLHLYGGTDHSPAADAVLVFPVPYGEVYAPTTKGFRVRMSGMAGEVAQWYVAHPVCRPGGRGLSRDALIGFAAGRPSDELLRVARVLSLRRFRVGKDEHQ